MEAKRIIMFELNEVPFRILDHFADLMPNSSLGKLKTKSRAYETYTEDTGHLSPWITWPSLHRGVHNEDHQISDFGIDTSLADKEFPPIWSILARSSIKTGVFGSLHSYPLPHDLSNFAFYVPDTFAPSPECFPGRLRVFQDFNLKMAGMNGLNVQSSIPLRESTRFLLNAYSLGVSRRTVVSLALQIANERVNKDRLVRRRTAQVQIAFDIYLRALYQNRPDISFFFTNHVASSLHRYWPSLFPNDFKSLKYDQFWVERWSDEIPFAMREAAYQIGQLMAFVERYPGYVLVVASSMGQAAVQEKEVINTQIVINSLCRLMSALGLSPADWQRQPAMIPQYIVQVNEGKMAYLKQSLCALSINGRHIDFKELGTGLLRMEFSIANSSKIEATFKGEVVNPETFGIQNFYLRDAAGANAYHIPQGMLIVYDPNQAKESVMSNRERISTLEVAPSILRNFGISCPSYMRNALDL